MSTIEWIGKDKVINHHQEGTEWKLLPAIVITL